MKNDISFNKSTEVMAKHSVTVSLILHTVTVFTLACIMLYAFIRVKQLWVIGAGVMLTAAITAYTSKCYQRCLSDFCNNHIRIVNCIAKYISCAFTVMQSQEKALSDHAMVVQQSFEALASLADELDAMQKPTEADKKDTTQESHDEDSDNQ